MRPNLQRLKALKEFLDILLWVGAIYALVNLATVRFVVQGASMEPTFQNDQLLIVSRLNYVFGNPQRGDIIVFHFPGDTTQDYIKRVIGLPGETVEIRDTHVYINGEQLIEPYINEPCDPYHCPDRSWMLGDDEYFVMGDNRNHSSDSRSDTVGLISRQYIVGEVLLRYWPLSDFRLITGNNY
ncbi:MAG: signal peptidase I [Chloroflexi bacterium]|nr:MAG: signal peptidase I [Chloroflexota bacterium]